MKKFSIILTLTFGLAILSSATVHAIQSMNFPGFMLPLNSSTIFEDEITLQNWMISPELFSGSEKTVVETDIQLEAWMLERSWDQSSNPMASEPEIGMEDWMLNAFESDNRVIALEDWMLSITG